MHARLVLVAVARLTVASVSQSKGESEMALLSPQHVSLLVSLCGASLTRACVFRVRVLLPATGSLIVNTISVRAHVGRHCACCRRH